jgi:hypothetical protein
MGRDLGQVDGFLVDGEGQITHFISSAAISGASRHLDRVPEEFADCAARGRVNERPSRSCAAG